MWEFFLIGPPGFFFSKRVFDYCNGTLPHRIDKGAHRDWLGEEKDKSEKGGNGGTGFVWH